MVEVTVTVEYNLSNTCGNSLCSYSLTNLGSLLFLRHSLHAKRRSSNES